MKHNESTQQTKCVKWFRTYYPDYVLFAVPNGGNRSAITGAILKAEGVMPGVADLFWHTHLAACTAYSSK